MALKIYTEGNYLFIDDTDINVLYEALSKDVLFKKNRISDTEYRVYGVDNFDNKRIMNIGVIKLSLGHIITLTMTIFMANILLGVVF